MAKAAPADKDTSGAAGAEVKVSCELHDPFPLPVPPQLKQVGWRHTNRGPPAVKNKSGAVTARTIAKKKGAQLERFARQQFTLHNRTKGGRQPLSRGALIR